MIDSYSNLISALMDWLVGHAITPEVAGSFVALAEAEMWRTLRVRQMVGRSISTLVDGYSALPGDFLAPLNLSLARTNNAPLRMITSDHADLMRIRLAGGPPQAFVLLGTEMECLPNPSGEVEVELVFYARPAALSAANPSNAILQLAPDLYLTASLAAAATYINDPQRGQFWQAEAMRLTQQLNQESDAASYGASPLVVRPRRTYP